MLGFPMQSLTPHCLLQRTWFSQCTTVTAIPSARMHLNTLTLLTAETALKKTYSQAPPPWQFIISEWRFRNKVSQNSPGNTQLRQNESTYWAPALSKAFWKTPEVQECSFLRNLLSMTLTYSAPRLSSAVCCCSFPPSSCKVLEYHLDFPFTLYLLSTVVLSTKYLGYRFNTNLSFFSCGRVSH